MIIGITGGTGCGKTTALDAIRAIGGVVLDCDAIYHELLTTDPSLLGSIEARFPGVVEKGQLQRKKLGEIVFNDPKALKDLNAITHAAVKAEVKKRLGSSGELTAIDAIGLFESGLNELCHVTVAVTAPLEDRVNRLIARDNITKEYALSRIRSQPDDGEFIRRCDHVLVNDGTQEAFFRECLAFFHPWGIMYYNDNNKGESL